MKWAVYHKRTSLRRVGALVAALALLGSWLLPALWDSSRGGSGDLQARRSVAYAAPAENVVDDAVILLDITGSMRGEGPDPRARDIWGKTIAAVTDIVDRLALQTNLAVVPFSNGPEWRRVSPKPIASGGKLTAGQLVTNADREAFKAQLGKLVPDGEATWIYESLEYSLSQLRQWWEADPTRTHRQALFLYTDGIDNGPHADLGIDGMVQLIRAQKGDNSSLYLVYNDLASYLSLEQKAKLANAGVTITVGPPASNVELVTENLDFGELPLSGSSPSRVIAFRSGFVDAWGKPVRLRLMDGGTSLPLSVIAETVQLREQVSVGIIPTGSLPAGQHRIRLAIEPVDGAFNLIPRNSVEVSFRATAPPMPAAAPAPVATAEPEPIMPEIAAATLPRQSIVAGVPDPLLFLGFLGILVVGSLFTLWQQELPPFAGTRPTMQVVWKLGGELEGTDEEGVRFRTIRPRKSRNAEQWKIGVEGYISLPEGGRAIKPNHARIAYGGRRQPGFKIVPGDGQVEVRGKAIVPEGVALGHGSTFEIGPYHFRSESVAEANQKTEA